MENLKLQKFIKYLHITKHFPGHFEMIKISHIPNFYVKLHFTSCYETTTRYYKLSEKIERDST
jgi:hypothetical protein